MQIKERLSVHSPFVVGPWYNEDKSGAFTTRCPNKFARLVLNAEYRTSTVTLLNALIMAINRKKNILSVLYNGLQIVE